MLQIGIGDELKPLGATGVVDQHVHPAQRAGQRFDGGVVSDIGHNCGSADLVGQRGDPVRPTRHRDHVKPLGRKGSRGCLADTGTGAGDHGDSLAGADCRHRDNSNKRAKFSVCTTAPCSARRPRVFSRARVVAAPFAAPDRYTSAGVANRTRPLELGEERPCTRLTAPHSHSAASPAASTSCDRTVTSCRRRCTCPIPRLRPSSGPCVCVVRSVGT
ncbi:Uncharacterised protein [Mycobacterium tuberculosis]|nr:Uncharacterised protein [Mycobacterium tuberculosis]CNV75079.1 Uncharacterised protein [Mycobacterium tuberculosis]